MARVLGLALIAFLATAGDKRYVEDFEFLVDTVKRDGAALKSKSIEWDAIVKQFRPRFEKCASDIDHVRNVMELLATLQDSHTDVTRHAVDGKSLPSKFDGLYGGGLFFGFDQGKFVLRGVMPGHSLAASLPRGSVLVSVGGEPAWLALGRDRRRVAGIHGISSDHSHFSSLANKLLPFGEKKQVDAEFLLPDGKTKKVQVDRWGPGGKSFDFVGLFLPEGLASAPGAISTTLSSKGSKKVGFLKITGSMDAATVKAFHGAFDQLQGMDSLLLDCRSMGGGGDDSAWEMCGRLFPKGADNGNQRRIAPSGSWQFDGPVVMLQDETEVSSAETFTWALSETRRVVSVGRPTGGWGIIPKGFSLPSRLADFRLGVNDRATPIRGVHTEGIGWPPDVLVPFGPRVCTLGVDSEAKAGRKDEGEEPAPDPSMALGLEILAVMRAGVAAEEARAGFHALAEGELAAFRAFAKKAAAKAKGFDGEKLARLFSEDLKGELELELAALALEDEGLPDLVGATKRLPRLAARAKAAGLGDAAAKLDKAVKAGKAELAAQEALLALPDPKLDGDGDDATRKSWLAKHGATRTGRFVKERLWK
jgi:hypothetical protein